MDRMKDIERLAMRTAPWLITLLTVAIFALDLFTPVGVGVSILYIIPLLLTYPSLRTKDSLYFSAVATTLIWVDVLISPPGLPIPYSLFNRTLGTMVMWLIAIGLVRHKQTEQELRSAQVEQAHAEGLMVEAQRASYYADQEAVQAIVGRDAAEEQLLISQLRLEGIVESAMDAIITVDEDHHVVLFNRAAEQMFGCPTREAIGQPLDRFLPTRFRGAHRHHVQGFGQSGVTSRKMGQLGSVMGLRSNGEEFPVEAAISHVSVQRKKYFTVILRDITERTQAESVLNETTERLQLLMQYAPAALAMLDRDLRYMAVSQRWITDYRLDGQILIGRSHYEVFPEIPERWKTVHQRGLAGEVIRCEEDHFVRQDGSEHWLQWEVRPWYTIAGAVGGIVFFTEDITGRKQGEEALQESQRQLSTLVGNLPGYVYRCQNDRDGTLLYVSDGVFDLTGYTVDEYLTRRIITRGEKTHPADHEQVRQEVQAALEQRRPYEMTYRILTKAGEVKWVWERGEGIYASDGILNYLEGFVTDITERKRAEHLLRQSEERYRRLIAVSPYAILVNRGDRVIFANDQAIKLFGAVKTDEILGKSPMDLFHPDFHEVVRERIHELLEGSPQVPMLEEKIVTLGGHAVDVEVSAARFVDEEGPALLIMFRDISERKRLQAQLRKTERIAELGTLASGMAHEIGTPMNVILGRAEYLMDRVTEEPIKKGLQTIITQVERITRVMNQLLSFARRKAPQRVALDLQRVVEDGLEMFQERLTHSHIQVVTEFAEGCPMVQADGDQMSQVFINLVMNALHAMSDGGLLRIGLAPERQMVKLTVSDSGHGIPHDVVKHIFDPFFTTKEFGKGTGLGLTVVKGIIEEHQGSIAVESKEGKGTTFTMLLPQSE